MIIVIVDLMDENSSYLVYGTNPSRNWDPSAEEIYEQSCDTPKEENSYRFSPYLYYLPRSGLKFDNIFSYFLLENRLWYFIQIVS